MSNKINKKTKSHKNKRLIVLIVICVIVLIICAFMIFAILMDYKQADDDYMDLADEVVTPAEPDGDGDDVIETSDINFDKLLSINPDCIAWIEIPGLDLSYPVMQSDDNEYYLNHTFERKTLRAASIFADYRNNSDFSDMNTIIYGHNMRSGSMFGILHKLKDRGKWKDANYVLIYLPDGSVYKYDIFSCFNTVNSDDVYTVFPNVCDEFTEYVSWLKESADYDTGIEVDGTKRILTLSTCTSVGARYSHRWIVNAVISEKVK